MLKPKLLIFDVNETLLDLSPLKNAINKALENDMGFEVWFLQLLQYSLVETITGNYNDFSSIAAAIFKMTAKKFDKEFSDEHIREILSKITQLPPHVDVVHGLKDLKQQGFIMVALTNGKPSVAKEQLEFAGLTDFFDDILSVEVVKKYKPAAETYHFVTDKYKIESSLAMMVAAHGWDIAGAKKAGLSTAFVKRPGKSPYALAESPDLILNTISELSGKLKA